MTSDTTDRSNSATTLEVSRADNSQTRVVEAEMTPLADGEVRFRVDRLALTANNITYAVAGDMLGYWDFFPASDGWGRVPAMGWADVVESAHPEVEVGGRYYGWFPMASHHTLSAGLSRDGVRDDGAHRQAHAEVYRNYVRTDRDPWYADGTDNEDRHSLLRGLFLTGFLADEFFAADDYRGAEQTVVLSASSKTAISYAQRAAQRDLRVVGLTSAANVDFVNSLGFYDQVVTYDSIDSLALDASVVVDMSGNSGVVAAIHDHLGSSLAHSMVVGMSHHDAPQVAVTAGPTPELFFAPTEVSRRRDEWGADGYEQRTTEALTTFIEASQSWLTVETSNGAEASEATWHEVRSGAVAPSTGRIISLHP